MKTLRILMLLRTSVAANVLIYYAQRLPLIGKHIPDSAYHELTVKRVFSIIGFLLTILWGIGSRIAFIGVMIILPITLAEVPETIQRDWFYHLFALLAIVAASYSSAKILEPTRERYTITRLMRMEPGRYMRLHLSYRYLTFGLYYLIALLLFASWSPLLTLSDALWLSMCITFSRIFAEFVHLWIFQKFGHILIKNQLLFWLVVLISFGLGYAPLFINLPLFGAIISYWPTTVVTIILGLAAAGYLLRYRGYRLVIEASTERNDPLLNMSQMITDQQIRAVQVDSDLNHVQPDVKSELHQEKGYAYLDKLFFSRYPDIIGKSTKKKLTGFIIAITGLSIIAALHTPSANWISKNFLLWFPMILLLPQLFMLGEQTCRSIFFNCDRSLMAYAFYRQGASQHFRLRLVRFSRFNLMIGCLLASGISLLLFVASGTEALPTIGWTWLAMCSMAIFNAVHNLLMYYLLQPYSTTLNVKNPYFIVVNLIFSGAIGFCIAMRVSASSLSIGLLLITIIYLLLSFIGVRKYARRTFRIR